MTRPREASVCAWGLALVLLSMVLPARTAHGDPGDEAALFAQLNAARQQSRVGPVGRSAELDAIARRHAARMAGAPHAFHNAGLRNETPGWMAVGEVVGRIAPGPGWDGALQRLFMSSPTHRRVMLSAAYTVVGVGTVRGPNGDSNAVEVVGRPSGAGAVRTPQPPRAARAARPRPAPQQPPQTPPPTTEPPTTTTTAPHSRRALLALPAGPQRDAPSLTPATHTNDEEQRPSKPLAVGATGVQVAALGAVASCATRSRRGGRRRPWC